MVFFNSHVEFLVNDRIIEEVRAVARDAYDLGREHEAEWQEGQPENYQLITLDELSEL